MSEVASVHGSIFLPTELKSESVKNTICTNPGSYGIYLPNSEGSCFPPTGQVPLVLAAMY